MTTSPWDSNSKGKQGSLRKAGIRKAIFGHPFLNLRKTTPIIPILPNIPVIQNWASSISPGEAATPTYHQHSGCERKSTKTEMQTGNLLTVAVEIQNLPLYQIRHVLPT